MGDLAVKVEGRWLVGFENHGGRTHLGPGVGALGQVARGRGNDGQSDGFRAERVWATYAHGPVLAINPWFADAILADVYGQALEALAGVADRLYAQRCAALSLTARLIFKRRVAGHLAAQVTDGVLDAGVEPADGLAFRAAQRRAEGDDRRGGVAGSAR